MSIMKRIYLICSLLFICRHFISAQTQQGVAKPQECAVYKQLLVAQSKLIANKINGLTDSGDIASAFNVGMSVLTDDNMPYTPEMEQAFRRTIRKSDFDDVEELMNYKSFPDMYAQKQRLYRPNARCHGSYSRHKLIENVCFCPNSNLIIFTCGGYYYLKNAYTGIEKRLEGAVLDPQGCVFSKDGKYAMSCNGGPGNAIVWSLPDGEFVKEIELDLSNEEEYISDPFYKSNFDGQPINNEGRTTMCLNDNEAKATIQDPVSGYYCVSDSSGTFIKSPDGELIQCLKNGMAKSISFSELGHLLVVDDMVYADESEDYGVAEKHLLDYSQVNKAAFSRDNEQLALYDENGNIYIYSTKQKLQTLQIKAESSLEKIEFSKSGQYLIAADEDGRHLYLWDIKDGKIHTTYQPDTHKTSDFLNYVTTDDHIYISYINDAGRTILEKWNLKDWKCVWRRNDLLVEYANGISVNEDETSLLFCSENDLYVYDLREDRLSKKEVVFAGTTGTGSDAMLAAEYVDNGILIVAGVGTHKVIDGRTLNDKYYLDGFACHVSAFSSNWYYNVSDNPKRLATITGDGILQVCDIDSGLLLDFTDVNGAGDDNEILGVGPDGKHVIVYDKNKDCVVLLKYPSLSDIVHRAQHSSMYSPISDYEKSYLNLK